MKTKKQTAVKSSQRSIGAEIITGLKQAVAYEKGEVKGLRTVQLTTREATADPAPLYTPDEIKALREKSLVSQALFAKALNLNAETVKAWEQGKRTPSGPALRLLEVVDHHPEWILSKVHAR